MPNILSVKNLTVRLDGEPVLKNISFEIDAGENLAVIGPNGSGKTVLLKTLLGFMPHEGNVAWAPNARIGYVPQKIDADRHLPLDLANLLSAKAQILELPKSDIASISETVGVTPQILKTPIGHLSGGQFQKALIAFALLGKPNVLILDEPTASIDKPGEEQIYQLIHRLQDTFNMTAIIVSHELGFVYRYATKVLCLNASNICFGTPEETLTPETLARLYGGQLKYYHHLHANGR